jgi:hypothetical protein
VAEITVNRGQSDFEEKVSLAVDTEDRSRERNTVRGLACSIGPMIKHLSKNKREYFLDNVSIRSTLLDYVG